MLKDTRDFTVDFTAASFGRHLECDKAEFKGKVRFNSIECGGNGSFKGTYFEKEVDFTAASFGRILVCSDAEFKGPGIFNSLKCDLSALVKNAVFEDIADFTHASFGLNLECQNTQFQGPAYFDTIKCTNSGYFGGAQFTGQGEIDFCFADFGHNLFCNRALFERAVDFTSANFGSRLECKDATFSDVVDLRFTRFGGDLDFRGATFAEKVRLGQSHLMQKFRLSRAEFKEKVELYDASIKIVEIIDNQKEIDDKEEIDEDKIFPFKKHSLDLTDISFERFHGGANNERSRRLAQRFAEAQDPEKFSRAPYLQLASFYKNIGDEAKEKDIYCKGRRALRESAKDSRSPAQLNWRQSVWDWFLDYSVAYGHQVSRLLALLVVLLGTGMWVFSRSNALIWKNEYATATHQPDPVQATGLWYADLWHSLMYNLGLLIPGQKFSPNEVWAPNPTLLFEVVTVVEVVFGWLLVAALTGIVKKD